MHPFLSLTHRSAACVKGNPFLWKLFWHGATRWPILLPHERAYDGLRHFANPQGGLMLDLAANNGISAQGFAKILPNYRIVCIEAHPRQRASLELAKQKLGGRMDTDSLSSFDAVKSSDSWRTHGYQVNVVCAPQEKAAGK